MNFGSLIDTFDWETAEKLKNIIDEYNTNVNNYHIIKYIVENKISSSNLIDIHSIKKLFDLINSIEIE